MTELHHPLPSASIRAPATFLKLRRQHACTCMKDFATFTCMKDFASPKIVNLKDSELVLQQKPTGGIVDSCTCVC